MLPLFCSRSIVAQEAAEQTEGAALPGADNSNFNAEFGVPRLVAALPGATSRAPKSGAKGPALQNFNAPARQGRRAVVYNAAASTTKLHRVLMQSTGRDATGF